MTNQKEVINLNPNIKLIIWLIFLSLVYLLFKTPIDFHNLCLKNIETYYLSDGFLLQDGYSLYKDIFCNKGPLQIFFYAFCLFTGETNEFAILRVRLLQSLLYLITLFSLTYSAKLIFKKNLITYLTPLVYILLPILFKGSWGAFDLQGAFLAEGEVLMSPFISLSLYFTSKYVFEKKSGTYIFISGLFSALAILTKLSGASFCLAVLFSGFLLLLVLRDKSFVFSIKNMIYFCTGALVPFLLFYLFLFYQHSINDFHKWYIWANFHRTGLPLLVVLKNTLPKIIFNNFIIFILILFFVIYTIKKIIDQKHNINHSTQFQILFLIWTIIALYAVLAPTVYAAHYYQGLWIAVSIPIAVSISKILCLSSNKIYQMFISLLLLFSSFNYNTFENYRMNYNPNSPGIPAVNKIYDETTFKDKTKFNIWARDDKRDAYLKISDIVRWTGKPGDTLYIWPGKSLVFFYSHTRPGIHLKPEMILNWLVDNNTDKAYCDRFLNDYFEKSILELIKKEPVYIIDSTPLLKEYSRYSIFKNPDFKNFLTAKYKGLFSLDIKGNDSTMDTITIYKRL